MVKLTLYIPSSHEQATNPGIWIPSYPVALTCVYTLGALSNVAEEQLALFVLLKILKCDILQNPESIRILKASTYCFDQDLSCHQFLKANS